MLRLPSILKTVCLLCFITLIVSCGTDDDRDTSSIPDTDQGTFRAMVNGTDFDPPFKTGFLTTSVNTIVLTGSEGDGELIQIFIPAETTTGTYSLDNNSSGIIAYYQVLDGDADQVAAFADSGVVTITSHNISSKRIEGTFEFTGSIEATGTTYTITSGVFALEYTDI